MLTGAELTAFLRDLASSHREHHDRYDLGARHALEGWEALELASEPVDLAGPWDPLADWLARLVSTRGRRWSPMIQVGGWGFDQPRPELGMLRIGVHFSYDVWVRPETHGLHLMHLRAAFPEEKASGSSEELFAALPIIAEYQARARPDLPNDQLRRLRADALARARAVAPSLRTSLERDIPDLV